MENPDGRSGRFDLKFKSIILASQWRTDSGKNGNRESQQENAICQVRDGGNLDQSVAVEVVKSGQIWDIFLRDSEGSDVGCEGRVKVKGDSEFFGLSN